MAHGTDQSQVLSVRGAFVSVSCRKSAQTRLALTAGVPVHIVAARLGNWPKTLLSVYSHLLPQSDEIAADRVAAALSA